MIPALSNSVSTTELSNTLLSPKPLVQEVPEQSAAKEPFLNCDIVTVSGDTLRVIFQFPVPSPAACEITCLS
eukprot:m.1003619 g.1003619  ORF g.1003619 m.1003619 type:complete len:72 (-) comp24045_c1_seq4:1760-1975(-)